MHQRPQDRTTDQVGGVDDSSQPAIGDETVTRVRAYNKDEYSPLFYGIYVDCRQCKYVLPQRLTVV
eukprot:1180953-Prorocentrum_minimum.AAC.4